MHEQVRQWNTSEYWIGCSGNFTIERFLHHRPDARLHSNDVSIYTCTIGNYLAGNPVELSVKPEVLEDIPWLADYMGDDADRVATLMLGTRFLQFVGKPGAYFDRMVDAHRRQFPQLHAKTKQKVEAVEFRVNSFHGQDVLEYLHDTVPEDGAVISFPPFDVGGYEKMFEPLEATFDWPEPEYPILDEDGIRATLEAIRDRERWIFASNHRHEDWEDDLVGVVQTSHLRRPNYVYASHPTTRIVKPKTKMTPVKTPRLGPGDRIGDTVTLAKLEQPQFEWLRSQYLNGMIKTGSPGIAVAVLSEGRIVGVIAARDGNFTPDEIYLMSDFAVPSSDYKHLSKLVVMAACSKEFQRIMQNLMSRRFRSVTTTAFTKNPVSMKYRGVLELQKRSKAKDENFNYELNYGGSIGRWTLMEAVAEWRRKGWDKLRNQEKADAR